MIRTRTFLLFLLAVAFLLFAIVLTVWLTADTSEKSRYREMIFNDDTATVTAEVIVPTDEKPGRLEALRKKLGNFTDVALAPTVGDEPKVVDVGEEIATTTDTEVKATAQLCSNYKTNATPQFTGTLVYSEEAHQRTFLKQVNVPIVQGTTTTAGVESTIVFTLPVRTTPVGVTSCIANAVVALTPTGLPIRNGDVGQYRGLGEGSLIGYTLDGFELYGQSASLETDDCGGAVVSGVYRYYLSSERKTILNCFVAIPVAL